jgi:hypothetical protein
MMMMMISWTARFSWEKKGLNIKRVFLSTLQRLSETFLILRRIQRYITLHVQYMCLHVVHPLFWSGCNQTYIFLVVFRKIFKYQISLKSAQCESSCFMRTDRQAWRN